MTNRMDDNKGKNALSFVLIVTKQSHQLRRQYKKESLLCFQAPSSDSFTPVNRIGEKLFRYNLHCISKNVVSLHRVLRSTTFYLLIRGLNCDLRM